MRVQFLRFFLAVSLGVAFVSVSHAQDRSPSAPALPQVHTPKIIDCPTRIEIAPNAQTLLTAGQTAQPIPSLYPAGFSGGQGLCTVTVAPDGTLSKKYSELSQLGQIPLLFDFNAQGFDIYAGDRVGDLVTNLPDIRCLGAVEQDRTVTCTINADVAGNFRILTSVGERAELAVDVDPNKVFERNVLKAGMLNYTGSPGVGLTSRVRDTPDCTATRWKDIAWNMILKTGSVEAGQLDTKTTVFFTGPNPPPYFGGYAFEADLSQLIDFSVDGDVANTVVQALLGAEGARLEVTMACGDNLSVEFLTTRVRSLSAIYNAIRPRL